MNDQQAEEINKLREKAVKLLGCVNELKKRFKNESNEQIKLKEKELKEVESKLLICQQEKEQIQKELDAEVEKVINSNLSNEEKSKQIIALTAENQKQFTTTCQHLSNAWQSYHQIQQKVIAVLESKSQVETAAIKRLEQTKNNQFIINGVLLAVLVIFFFCLLFRKTNQSAPKNKLPALNEE